MITHEWQQKLGPADVAEVRDLVAEAVEYDSEAEFAGADPFAEGPGVWKCLVWLHVGVDVQQQWALAAFLRATVEQGRATVQLVVRPAFRSLGVSTQLMEQLGSGGDMAGWASIGGTSLHVCAQGDHPAADRMARRFGAVRDRVCWTLLHDLDRVPDVRRMPGFSIEALDVTIAVRFLDHSSNPAKSWLTAGGDGHLMADGEGIVARDDRGAVRGVLRFGTGSAGNGNGTGKPVGHVLALDVEAGTDHGELGAFLLAAGLDRLRRAGVRVARVDVDERDDWVVGLARRAGFRHDRTDVHYSVGRRAVQPA